MYAAKPRQFDVRQHRQAAYRWLNIRNGLIGLAVAQLMVILGSALV